MRVLVILALVLTAFYVWPGFAIPPAPEPFPPKRVFAQKLAPQPAQAQAPSPDSNPECRWSRAMRSDPNLRCKGEAEAPPLRPAVQAAPEATSDLPIVNVEAACREAYGSSGNQTISACLRREQSAYDVARYAWMQISPQAREKCRGTADQASSPRANGRHVFYSVLGNCVAGALEAEQFRQDAESPPRFRY